MSYLTPCYTDLTAAEIEEILKTSSGMPAALEELSGQVVSLTNRVEDNEVIFNSFSAFVSGKIEELIEFSACTERDIAEIRVFIDEINERIIEISGKLTDYEIVMCDEVSEGDEYTYKLVKKDDATMTPQGELIHIPLCKFTDYYKDYLDKIMEPVIKVEGVDWYNNVMPENGYVIFGGEQFVKYVRVKITKFPENLAENVKVYVKMHNDTEARFIGEIPLENIPTPAGETTYLLPVPSNIYIRGEQTLTLMAESKDKLGRTIVGITKMTRTSTYPCYMSSTGNTQMVTSAEIKNAESRALIEGDKCIISNNNTTFRDYLWLYVPCGYSLKWALLREEGQTFEESENIEGFEEMDYTVDVGFSYDNEMHSVPYKVYRTDLSQIEYNFQLYLLFTMHGEMYYGANEHELLTIDDTLTLAHFTKHNDVIVNIDTNNGEYIWLCMPFEKSITMIRQNIVYNVTNDFEIFEDIPETKYGRLKCYRSKNKQKAGPKEMKIVVK